MSNHAANTDWLVKLIFIFVGFSLSLIPREIDRSREKKEIRLGILTELDEMKFRLSLAVYLIIDNYGRSDDEPLLNWVKKNAEGYTEIYSEMICMPTLTTILELSPKERKKIAIFRKSKNPEDFRIPKYPLPYLEANLCSIKIFGEKSQRQILEIRAQMFALNEEIELSHWYHKKTGSSLDRVGRLE